MKADIQSFVQACVVCQQAEPDRAKYPGLLQPLVPYTFRLHLGKWCQWTL
jgi:hypothetical protein